jgi:hypothetical protein
MIYIAAALSYCFGAAATVVLVLNEHPWFALLILLVTGGISWKETPKSEDK